MTVELLSMIRRHGLERFRWESSLKFSDEKNDLPLAVRYRISFCVQRTSRYMPLPVLILKQQCPVTKCFSSSDLRWTFTDRSPYVEGSSGLTQLLAFSFLSQDVLILPNEISIYPSIDRSVRRSLFMEELSCNLFRRPGVL